MTDHRCGSLRGDPAERSVVGRNALAGYEAVPSRLRPRHRRRRLPSVHHELAARRVLPGRSSNAVSVSLGGKDAVP
ncbi:hypothetical protein HSR121_3019 [Halapricum desulfuricans]|uniref:Uncharacterized protein n=1 Tax=Halapricum desulfuricans TaxID=2841257 RepID=A0A897N4B7_9EURY|nr:hypothetical protein HSR121_3019 [Halapricum desulfuricans]